MFSLQFTELHRPVGQDLMDVTQEASVGAFFQTSPILSALFPVYDSLDIDQTRPNRLYRGRPSDPHRCVVKIYILPVSTWMITFHHASHFSLPSAHHTSFSSLHSSAGWSTTLTMFASQFIQHCLFSDFNKAFFPFSLYIQRKLSNPSCLKWLYTVMSTVAFLL